MDSISFLLALVRFPIGLWHRHVTVDAAEGDAPEIVHVRETMVMKGIESAKVLD
jgi:hypothetical protein